MNPTKGRRVYLMISTYVASTEDVDSARPDHLTFLKDLLAKGVVVSAGRQDPPVGGLVILDVDSAEAAHRVMADDPYVQRGLAEYTALGWKPTMGALSEV